MTAEPGCTAVAEMVANNGCIAARGQSFQRLPFRDSAFRLASQPATSRLPMSDTSAPTRKRFSAQLARWAAELLLVFLGAYAAFWLTNHQEHQKEVHRRQQILTALEEQISADLESAKALRDSQAK